jgi:hypothetical protein
MILAWALQRPRPGASRQVHLAQAADYGTLPQQGKAGNERQWDDYRELFGVP